VAPSRGEISFTTGEAGEFVLESVLEEFRIDRNEGVFGGEGPISPRHSNRCGREGCDFSDKFIAQGCGVRWIKHLGSFAFCTGLPAAIAGWAG
jgi:hypothetical protein